MGQELEKEGHLGVYYGNESGVCLTSAIPYGWQFPGEDGGLVVAVGPPAKVAQSAKSRTALYLKRFLQPIHST